MTYPAKPVLVGKVVRCKGCRNAFILQADGTATKAAPETAAPAPAAPAPAPTPPPANPAPPQSAPPRPTTPRPSTERSQRRKSEHLEAARAKMAADLAAVAAKAAESEVAKREERRSERLAKVGATGKAAEDAKRSQHTAVLTGEGERQHRELMLWLLGGLAVVGIIVLAVVLLTWSGPCRAALDAYTAQVPPARVRFPLLGATIQARAWVIASPGQVTGPQIATDLSDAVFEPERVLELDTLADALAPLKGMRFVEGLGWWAAPADHARLKAACANHPAKERARIIADSRIPAVEHAAWLKRIELPDEDRRILCELIAGRPSPEGTDLAAAMLDDGRLPKRVLLRGFHGLRGGMLVTNGPPKYISKILPYRGTLLRFDEPSWPKGWRVLELKTVEE